jgi:hypothetical protein
MQACSRRVCWKRIGTTRKRWESLKAQAGVGDALAVVDGLIGLRVTSPAGPRLQQGGQLDARPASS